MKCFQNCFYISLTDLPISFSWFHFKKKTLQREMKRNNIFSYHHHHHMHQHFLCLLWPKKFLYKEFQIQWKECCKFKIIFYLQWVEHFFFSYWVAENFIEVLIFIPYELSCVCHAEHVPYIQWSNNNFNNKSASKRRVHLYIKNIQSYISGYNNAIVSIIA